jgi:hypothetical protein
MISTLGRNWENAERQFRELEDGIHGTIDTSFGDAIAILGMKDNMINIRVSD